MEQCVSHGKQQMQKPKLEIPDSSLKLAGNGSSPRGMHGFPQSPQGLEVVSPVSSHLKTFEEWTTQSAPVSPATRVADDSELKRTSLHFYVGECVLLRCNQSKWLLGQVRRSSKTGVRIWVGAAQTLVNVPFVLLASHIVKLDSPSLPTCPSSTLSLESLEVGRHGEILAPFQCVRPAHLSHRKLFQPLGLLPKEKSEGVNKVRTVQFDSEHPLHAVCPTLKDPACINNKLNKDLILQYKYNGRGCLGSLASSSLPAYVPASFKEELAAKDFTTESYYGVPVLRGRVVAGQPTVMSTLCHPALPEKTSNPVQEPVRGSYIFCKFKFPEDPSSDSIANFTKNLHSSGTSSQIVDKRRFRNEYHFPRNSLPQAEKRETWGAGGMGMHEQEEGGKTQALVNESECTWITVIQNGLNVRKNQPDNLKKMSSSYVRRTELSNLWKRTATHTQQQIAESTSRDEEELYAQLVRSCGNARDLATGREVHARILHSEHQRSRYLSNLLIEMYGKCGSSDDASLVFEVISQPNVYSWNLMIKAFTQNGNLQEARNIFERMPVKDVFSWTAMVAAYAQKGHLEEASSNFEKMPHRNAVSWTAMLTAYAQQGQVHEARSMFERMPQWDAVSWTAMISAYVQTGNVEEAKTIFDTMEDRDIVSWNSMVAAYAQIGNAVEPKSMFEKMPQHDVVSWNAVTAAYAQTGYLDEANSSFHRMPDRDVVSWTAMVASYAQHGYLVEGMNFFNKMPQWDVVSWNAMAAAYAQNGQTDEARSMFDRMPNRSTVSWNLMIAAFVFVGQLHDAIAFFHKMPEHDLVAWNAVIAGHAQNRHLDEARSMFDRMPQQDVVSWNAMVAAYAQNGRLDEARHLFDKMPVREVASWNTMITAFAQTGHRDDALELFHRMSLEGLKPDQISFVSVLAACGHAGLVEEGWSYFISMRADCGLRALIEHYHCMVGILGRAGRLEEAEDLVNNMPFLPDVLAWTALLGTCLIHGDTERGLRAAKQAIELDPEDNAVHVMLSNLYAAAGRPDDVTVVRMLMKNKGVKKTPGCSFIDVKSRQCDCGFQLEA